MTGLSIIILPKLSRCFVSQVPKAKHHVLQHVYSLSGPFTLDEGNSMRPASVTTVYHMASLRFKPVLRIPFDTVSIVKCRGS